MNDEREKIIGLTVDCGFVVTNSHDRRDTTVWSAYEGEILTFANALLEMCATDIRMMKFSADDDDR